MAKKKSQLTCPNAACRALEWRSWAGKCCKECGTPFRPSTGGGKGSGKDKDSSTDDTTPSGVPPTGARPKPAANFKFATAAMVEGLEDETLRVILRAIEGSKDRDSLLAAGAKVPGLEATVASLAELRWPATSPDKECQREHTKAQQDERAAEKALGDARATAAKLRVQLDEAEAAEVKAAETFEAAKAKSGELALKFGALKGGQPAASDAAMQPPDATVAIEGIVGKVRLMVANKEAAAKRYAEAFDLQASKGLGKGKGTGARADAAPYTPSGDGEDGFFDASSGGGGGSAAATAGKDLQALRDNSTKTAAALKEIMLTMEQAQLTINTCMAKVSEVAEDEKEL